MDRERASPAIVVVGSANLDVVVPVERHPRPGETVLGGDHYRASGGKGANQAVACVRLGAQTRFVGCVGDDDAGRTLHDALAGDGVDVSVLATRSDAPSGIALIVVAPDGENTIVVSPGANGRLDEAQVDRAELAAAAAVLLQLEIPMAAVTAAAHAAEGLVVLNPAPARELPDALLERTDVLVPNRSELATLVGADAEPTTHDEVLDLARSLPGVSRVVVTLGADGALVADRDAVAHVPAHPVAAVDATAAGDSFCGALTVALTEGATLQAAAAWACTAAAVTVTSPGAQPSLPTRAQVDELSRPASR
jgi:ribokinase